MRWVEVVEVDAVVAPAVAADAAQVTHVPSWSLMPAISHRSDTDTWPVRRASLPGGDCHGGLNMVRPLWQLLLEDPSNLTCDECFAVLEYYSELLARGGADLLPEITEHLQGCPECRIEHQEALRHLEATYLEEQNGASK